MRTAHPLTCWVLLGLLLWTGLAPAAELHQQIDAAIQAKAGGPLASLATDAEFLRRASLDFTGRIPTAAQVREFVASKDPAKREKLIDQLLANPDFPRRMEDAITVMLLERRTGGKVPESKWRDWLREQIAANRPWNVIVRELLLVEGDPKSQPAAKFMADGEKLDHDKLTQDIARLFLGHNLQCAQCHDHPTIDDFTQAEYFGLYAFVTQTNLKEDKKIKASVLTEGLLTNKVEFKSVFKKEGQSIGPRLPGGSEIVIPAFAKGDEFAVPPADGAPGVLKFRPRQLLAKELTAAENRQFVRTSVNRFWFLMMGRGLVHPLDLDNQNNPPSHPELLDTLGKAFTAHDFDLRWLLRELALSTTYQRSSRAPSGSDVKDIAPGSYRIANLKPLSAEQVAYASMFATGVWEPLSRAKSSATPAPSTTEESDAPPAKPTKGFNLKAYLSGISQEPPGNLAETLTLFVATFGNPPGDPEVEFAPSMSHSLFLMNERLLLGWLKPAGGNLVDRLGKLTAPAAIAEELYLSVLTRAPEPEEVAELGAYLEKHKERREAALGELAWALLASAEFRLNH